MPTQPRITLDDGNIMPQLGLGVWQTSNEQAKAAVLHALNTGYRAVDTAAIYNNEQGVGLAIQQAGLPRDQLFITTKLWNNRHLDADKALEESLEKLRLNYVDLYLIHWPVPEQDQYVQAWKSLIKLKEQGLTKSIGVSNFHSHHIQRLLDETGVTPVVNQIELHPLMQQHQMHAWNAMHNIATESWSPLAQGGKDVFDHPVIHELAKRYEKTPAQIVIRWHLDSGLIVIPKSITPERIEENFAVDGFKLTKDELGDIAKIDKKQRLGPDPDNFNVLKL